MMPTPAAVAWLLIVTVLAVSAWIAWRDEKADRQRR